MDGKLNYPLNTPEGSPAAILRTADGRSIVLRGVSIRVALRDLTCETEVVQKYHNKDETNIEAVYSFPLPVDAVLLDLEVRLAGKTLRGRVIERKAAQEKYEDAVTDGDSAVLLEQSADGLCTMNLGNLLAGETAEIRLRYGVLLNWSGDTLRVLIPTTLAPRYGKPGGLQPHELPEHSLAAEYPLDLVIIVDGAMANAAMECPSHAVTVDRSREATLMQLKDGATLDRDFVLNLRAPTAAASAGSIYPDGNGCVALAALRPDFAAPSEIGSRSVKIAVDCSGSMNGDSILQARTALGAILEQLRPGDEFNIIAFGTAQKALFPRQAPVGKDSLARAAAFVAALAADMGGTEMEAALSRAMALPGTVEQADILLITDGEVWNHDSIAALAVKTHHRLFTVGVGSAVAESVLRQLSDSTGGACELVSPRENMAVSIVRQFQRIYQPFAVSVTVTWPVAPMWQHPHPIATVFGGDTLHLMAGFAAPVEGEVVVELQFADGSSGTQALPLAVVPAKDGFAATAPRLAAARRLKTLEKTGTTDAALQLALTYQLISPYTAYFVAAERDDKAKDLPELRVTPQMLAAGWGGVGTVHVAYDMLCEPPAMLRRRILPSPAMVTSYSAVDAPAFLRRSADDEPGGRTGNNRPTDIAESLNLRFKGIFLRTKCPSTLQELVTIEIPAEVWCTIKNLISRGWDEALVVACFLHRLSLCVPAGTLSRNSMRAIAKAAKKPIIPSALSDYFQHCLQNVTSAEWNWAEPNDVPHPDSTTMCISSGIEMFDIPQFLRKHEG